MQDHYTTEQLRDRSWTSLMIKAHLGKADEQRSDPNGQLRKTIKLYRIERVHAAEAGTARSDLEKRSEATALAKRALQLKKSKHSS
jgi:hypothetical protein